MFTAREIDRIEQQYVDRGAAFFSVSGAGHEASAALAPFLGPRDWLHCHYRDKALLVARGLPIEEFFRSLFCKETSHSKGRQMSAHFANQERNLLSIPGPVGNNVLPDVGIAAALKDQDEGHLIVSSMGDGTTQQGEVMEGLCEAARSQLPILFLIHDNKLAISVKTEGKTLFSTKDPIVIGIPTRYVDGADFEACWNVFEESIKTIRKHNHPVSIVLDCERMCDHSNADDQSIYRNVDELRTAFTRDPITALRSRLIRNGHPDVELTALETEIRNRVETAAKATLIEPPGEATRTVFPPQPVVPAPRSDEHAAASKSEVKTLSAALNQVLRNYLHHDRNVFLYGQDIEDPKGDVFGVTKGLSTDYPGRVVNSPLSESTIIGTCMGRSIAGQHPVAFIQFADFLPLAFNQILSELSTLAWRTADQYRCPMVVIVSSGGYRPGLGPFHAQTMDAYLCHTPGIQVVTPSNAADAAGLLVAAMELATPTIYLYPKALLYEKTAARPIAENVAPIPIGPCVICRPGSDITLVGWGNLIPLLHQVADSLQSFNVSAEIIDLRTLAPWDPEGVIESASKTQHLLVAHEDNQTCGLAAEIIATVATRSIDPIATKRVCRPDVPIPCSYPAQLQTLPSYDSLLEAACELLDLELAWRCQESPTDDRFDLQAIGSSPTDSEVNILEWKVAPGEAVSSGDVLVEIEANKASFEFYSPVTGTLSEIVIPSFTLCSVGDCIARISLAGEQPQLPSLASLPQRIPTITRRAQPESARTTGLPRPTQAFIYTLKTGIGSKQVPNETISALTGMSPEEIRSSTGIESRSWYASEEEMEQAVIRAIIQLIRSEPAIADRLGLLLVSTGTNSKSMPSRACRLAAGVSSEIKLKSPGAYDFYTACSGYIYGLEQAKAYLQLNPDRDVLLVTAEMLSRFLDKKDRNTAILFGDAFSISLISGPASAKLKRNPLFEIKATHCCSKPDPEDHLTLAEGETISMDGGAIFLEASRAMPKALDSACKQVGLDLNQLDFVIPHQANHRIIEAIARRLRKHRIEVFSNVEHYGNTSSTTIPLGLENLLQQERINRHGIKLGLTAFGGGYTYAGAVLERITTQ